MNFKELKISDLKPAEYNPRNMSDKNFNRLKKDLSEFGLRGVIVVNADNTIIAGHQRIKAWSELGHETVWAEVVDFDKKKEKKLNVILNSPTVQGDFDRNKLDEILSEFALDDDFEELGLDDLTVDDVDYTPNLTPETSYDSVSQEDVDKKADELESKFTDINNAKDFMDITCPECGHDFTIKA